LPGLPVQISGPRPKKLPQGALFPADKAISTAF
jgi:hypothetical protein